MTQASLCNNLKQWSDSLAESSETPRLDTEVIFKHVSGLSDAQLITQADQTLSNSLISKVDRLIQNRKQGTPVAHIVGLREFYSIPLIVNEHVLIPRPETELLVDQALEIVATTGAQTLLDLGTGSGAIALAIAHHAPDLAITALDRNVNALQTAKQNALRLSLNNIRFIQSNWYAGLVETQNEFDVIVANPPYIAQLDAHLNQGDVRFEPESALVSADNGLADLQHIIYQAPSYLRQAGQLVVEHGYNQAEAVQAFFGAAGFKGICTRKDLSQNDRITFAHR